MCLCSLLIHCLWDHWGSSPILEGPFLTETCKEGGGIKMAEEEDVALIFSHRHIKKKQLHIEQFTQNTC